MMLQAPKMGSTCITMAVFVALMLLTNGMSYASQCGRLQMKFHPASDRVLKNFTYDRKMAPNDVICGRECSVDKECKSFNFHKVVKLCELNNSTRSDHPEAFIEDQGVVYFDGDEETSLSLPDVRVDLCGSCKELLETGYHTSGVFKIYPSGFSDGLDVFCDMETDGGGWIVFQRRQDGSVDFYRSWAQYQSGFGDLGGEHWLGNDKLVSLTSDTTHGPWELRIDFTRLDGEGSFAKYSDFKITGDAYILSYGAYLPVSSVGSDSLQRHRGRPFSAVDRDNDASPYLNCAEGSKGAWWFNNCFICYFNGPYSDGLKWGIALDRTNPIKKSSMKIR